MVEGMCVSVCDWGGGLILLSEGENEYLYTKLVETRTKYEVNKTRPAGRVLLNIVVIRQFL